MAHPCCICGCECYCHGDWDDVITCKTPKNCESCGCEDEDDEEGWDEYDDEGFEDWEENEIPSKSEINDTTDKSQMEKQ